MCTLDVIELKKKKDLNTSAFQTEHFSELFSSKVILGILHWYQKKLSSNFLTQVVRSDNSTHSARTVPPHCMTVHHLLEQADYKRNSSVVVASLGPGCDGQTHQTELN